MSHNEKITNENIDEILKSFAKEQRKLSKNVDIDIVIIVAVPLLLTMDFVE